MTIAAPRRNAAPAAGARVALVLRPEEIALRRPGETAERGLAGTITEIGYQGDSYRLSVASGGEAIKVRMAPHLALAFTLGLAVEMTWPRDTARVLPLDDHAKGAA
jgi:ABC-type Fe3+/spermidine/putrescine transport system ATPase subunit